MTSAVTLKPISETLTMETAAAEKAALIVGDKERLSIETPKGGFFNALKDEASATSGARDLAKMARTACTVLHGPNRINGYLDTTAVFYLPVAAINLGQTLAKPFVWTAHTVSDLTHQFFDVLATAAYAIAVFVKTQLPFLNAGAFLGMFSDSTEFASYTTDCIDSTKRRQLLAGAPKEFQVANEHKISYARLKMVKTVTAAVADIFACYLLVMGAALVPAAVALAVAFTSTLFSMLAFYHDNYWVNSNLKVELLPVKHA